MKLLCFVILSSKKLQAFEVDPFFLSASGHMHVFFEAKQGWLRFCFIRISVFSEYSVGEWMENNNKVHVFNSGWKYFGDRDGCCCARVV